MDKILEQLVEYGRLNAEPTPSHVGVAHRMVLGSLLGEEAPWVAEPPPAMRAAAAFPVRFTTPDGFERGEVRALSGKGAWIATRRRLPLGQRALLRFDDTEFGTYVFPTLVAARRSGRLPALGLLFDGMPERTVFEQAWMPSLLLARPIVYGRAS